MHLYCVPGFTLIEQCGVIREVMARMWQGVLCCGKGVRCTSKTRVTCYITLSDWQLLQLEQYHAHAMTHTPTVIIERLKQFPVSLSSLYNTPRTFKGRATCTCADLIQPQNILYTYQLMMLRAQRGTRMAGSILLGLLCLQLAAARVPAPSPPRVPPRPRTVASGGVCGIGVGLCPGSECW